MLQLFVREAVEVLRVVVEHSDGLREIITATIEHPFYVTGKGWCGANALEPDDKLELLRGGQSTVVGVESVDSKHTVYNFEVADDHTYFVGERGVWVHNASTMRGVASGGISAITRPVQLDANVLMKIARGEQAFVDFAKTNMGSGLRYNFSTRFEYIVGGARAGLRSIEDNYGLQLIREINLDAIQNTASTLRGAFKDSRILGYWDSQVASTAFLNGERLATGDLQFFKRLRDLGVSAEFIGAGRAADRAAAYVPNPVVVLP